MLSPEELESRVHVFFEKYCKQILIEAEVLAGLVQTSVLPAVWRHQTDIAQTIASTEAIDLENPELRTEAQQIVEMARVCHTRLNVLRSAINMSCSTVQEHAAYIRDSVRPAMEDLRETVDELETHIASSHWPIPTYQEMLVIK